MFLPLIRLVYQDSHILYCTVLEGALFAHHVRGGCVTSCVYAQGAEPRAGQLRPLGWLGPSALP